VLASRSGPADAGVPALAASLAAAGTEVRVTACDSASAIALPNGWGMQLPGSWHKTETDILGQVLAGFATT